MKNNYYKIVAYGGHVGAGNSVELVFYIKAKNMLKAITIVRSMPCIKHHKASAILSGVEIDKDEYEKGRAERSAYDVYNKVKK